MVLRLGEGDSERVQKGGKLSRARQPVLLEIPNFLFTSPLLKNTACGPAERAAVFTWVELPESGRAEQLGFRNSQARCVASTRCPDFSLWILSPDRRRWMLTPSLSPPTAYLYHVQGSTPCPRRFKLASAESILFSWSLGSLPHQQINKMGHSGEPTASPNRLISIEAWEQNLLSIWTFYLLPHLRLNNSQGFLDSLVLKNKEVLKKHVRRSFSFLIDPDMETEKIV